jgi:hypothetical protein
MANAFKNITVTGNHLANTDIDVGSTVGSATTTHTLIGMTIANITGSTITVEVLIENASSRTWIVRDAPISSGGSLVPCGGDQKIVLWYHDSAGDQLIVRSNTANSTNIVLSYLEST